MQKNILLFFCLLTICFTTHAQKRLEKPCTITFTDNTKKNGFIVFLDWSISPQVIEFKETLNDTFKEYKVNQVNEIEIVYDNSILLYKSLHTNIIKYPSSAETSAHQTIMQSDYVVPIDSVSVFAECLLKSEQLSLYKINDSEDLPHYFIDNQGIITELENYSYLVNNPRISNTYVRVKKEGYKDYFADLFNDDKSFDKKSLIWNDNGLIKVCERYLASKELTYTNFNLNNSYVFAPVIGLGLANNNEDGIITNGINFVEAGLRIILPKKYQNRTVEITYVHFLNTQYEGRGILRIKGSYFLGDEKAIQPILSIGLLNFKPMVGVGLGYKKKIYASAEYAFSNITGLNFSLKYSPFKSKK
jgi:hypothetical protein